MPYTVKPQISGRQISERFSFRMILFGNRIFIRHFVSFIQNFAFQVQKIYFLNTKHCLTTNFASFNQTLKFADTPLQQKLSFTFFLRESSSLACINTLTSPITFNLPTRISHASLHVAWVSMRPQVSSLFKHSFILKNALLNQENQKDSQSVVVYLPKSKVILKRIVPYKPCQINSKPKAREENKKACYLIESALVDLAIFKIMHVNVINEIDFLKEKDKRNKF